MAASNEVFSPKVYRVNIRIQQQKYLQPIRPSSEALGGVSSSEKNARAKPAVNAPLAAADDEARASVDAVRGRRSQSSRKFSFGRRTRSIGHRHRPKRAKQPRTFAQWEADDRAHYHEISIQLRRWKATQRTLFCCCCFSTFALYECFFRSMHGRLENIFSETIGVF